MDDDFGEEFEGLTLEQELQHGANQGNSRTLPEKRLDTPVCDGLIRRLVQYATDFEKKRVSSDLRSLSDRPSLSKEWGASIQGDPQKTYSNILPSLRQFADICRSINQIPEPVDPRAYPKLYALSDVTPQHLETDFDLTNKIFNETIDAYVSWISDVCKSDEVERVRRNLQRRARNDILPLVERTSCQSSFWSRVVDKYRDVSTQDSLPRKFATNAGITMWFGTGFAVIVPTDERSGLGKPVCVVYEQLQMIQDATLARHNVYTALCFNLHCGTGKLRTHVESLIAWQERCLARYGNRGFELVKAPEAVYKTWINSLTRGDILAVTSYDRTLEKIRLKERGIESVTALTDELDSLVRKCNDIRDAVELFGLIKLSGHPIVYAETSAKSVKEEATFRDCTRPLSAIRVVRAVKHIILSAYITKHQEWPPFKKEPPYGSALRSHRRNRVTTLPLGSYPLSDLDVVEFGQFLTFDYSEDFLKFLDDKAISAGADQVWKFWWPADRDEPRRLLLKALNEKKIDMKDLVERMRRGMTTRNEEVVELTQKERELKPAARCFCKLPFYVRCFFTLTEYNLGESLMSDYFPQQTMTMTDSQTKSRLYNMAFRTKGKENVVLEIDFSRWNLRWRSSVVNMVARVLENIYGLPGVFSQAHKFFARATVVLTDSHTLPRGATPNSSAHSWPESELVWRNHLGGFEGIQQKLWTICTIGMVYTCVWDRPCQFLMAGQGDNQVLVITFKKQDHSLAKELTILLGQLEFRCKRLNQIVKPDECIDSKTVLTYSKEIYVEGVHYQYSLKFLSRTMAVHDSDIPSLSSEISSVCSSAVAVANTLPIPLTGFWWQCWRLIRMFREHARFSPSMNVSYHLRIFLGNPDLLQFLLQLPGSIGGCPLLTWTRYLIRGEVDELSWDIAAILRCASKNQLKDLRLLQEGRYSPITPDLTSLLLDPYSIPLRRPKDQTRLIKEQLELSLPRITKNTWLYEILTTSVSVSGEQLIQDLVTTRPFYPTIMSDIYAHSLAGLRDEVYGRFNITRTIAKAVGGLSFAREIAESSAQLLTWVRLRYTNACGCTLPTNRFSVDDCYGIASSLRQKWGFESTESLGTTYCPVAASITMDIMTNPCISANSRSSIKALRSTTGIYPPNFGTSTKQKRSEHGYKIHTSDDTVRHLKSLVTTASQIAAGPEMRKLICNIVHSRSPWTLESIEPIFPTVYGGSAAHRHDSIRKKAFGLLGSTTLPGHLSLSSDNSGPLAGGDEDYAIVIQTYYLLLSNLAQVLSVCLPDTDRPFTAGIGIGKMIPLSADAVDLPKAHTPAWKISVSNKLAYVSQLQIDRISERPPQDVVPDRARRGKDYVIVASYLLSKLNTKLDSITRPDSFILHPHEMFDIAEIAGCTLTSLLIGYAIFAVVEASWITVRLGLRDTKNRLRELILSISNHIAGPLARGLLTPASGHLSELSKEHIHWLPGRMSCLSLSRALAGRIAAVAHPLLRSDFILTLTDPFILFADTANSGLAVVRKLACFYMLQPWSLTVGDLRLPLDARSHVLNSFFVSRSVSDALSTMQFGIKVVQNILERYTHSQNRAIASKASTCYSSWPNIVWDKRDSDEAKRDLRVRKFVSLEGNTLSSLACLTPAKIRYRITSNSVGMLPYPNNPDRITSCRKTLIVNRLQRPIGVTSTAVSVWYPILRANRDDFTSSNVLTVGVGRGAVARCVIALDCQSVVGLDLHTYFPEITQREVSFVPPELLGEMTHKFKWHPEVFGVYQGDWIKIRDNDSIDLTPYDAIIIDIESTDHRISELLPKASGLVCYVRIFLTVVQLRWIILAYSPSAVYYTDCVPAQDDQSASYILRIISREDYSEISDTDSVELTAIPVFKNHFTRGATEACARLNNMLAPFGVKSDSVAGVDLIKAANQLPITETKLLPSYMTTLALELKNTMMTCAAIKTMDHVHAVRRIMSSDPGQARAITDILAGSWLAD